MGTMIPGPRYAIHDDAAKKQSQINVMRPQEPVPEKLPPNFAGTMSQGLPVKQIPAYKFPLIVYLHPNEPLREIEHRNDKFELVGVEVVPAEHLSKVIACPAHEKVCAEQCDECELLLEQAKEDGWVLEPYIPKPTPKRDAGLYAQKKKKQA